jgi:hypothetical protein
MVGTKFAYLLYSYLCLHLKERQFISRAIHTSQAKAQHAPLNREHPPAQPTIRQQHSSRPRKVRKLRFRAKRNLLRAPDQQSTAKRLARRELQTAGHSSRERVLLLQPNRRCKHIPGRFIQRRADTIRIRRPDHQPTRRNSRTTQSQASASRRHELLQHERKRKSRQRIQQFRRFWLQRATQAQYNQMQIEHHRSARSSL